MKRLNFLLLLAVLLVVPAFLFAADDLSNQADSENKVSKPAKETTAQPSSVGTIEGIQKGAGKLVKSAAKGTYKVATLGYGDPEKVVVENPKREADITDPTKKDPTRFKIKF